MTRNADAKIRVLVDNFVSELSGLIHQATVEAAMEALGRSSFGNGVARRGPGRPPRAAAAAMGGAKGKRLRRSLKQIERTMKDVQDYIRKHANARAEEIRKSLSLTPIQTRDALKRLVEKKEITAKGRRRATRYSVA
jgi:hypothetical protein